MKRSKADKLNLLSTNNKKFTTGGNSEKKSNEQLELEEEEASFKGPSRKFYEYVLHLSNIDIVLKDLGRKFPLEVQFWRILPMEYN